ncbi:MAG: CBS domain-containing protein [Burkholderiaceae bacterium]|nr:CBS domain-containing protein [Burkholderiaceae bacterium]
MIVRNWMQPHPMLVSSTLLVSEAKRLVSENHLHALPVVDDGRLRGLVTRANLLRMGQFVLHTQDPDEFNFFVTRLRVRDIMVRNPDTVQATDTMEECLRKGQAKGVAQFPVLDDGAVVGVISANEIFQIAANFLGAWEHRNGITIGPVCLGPGTLGQIAEIAESAGAVLQALYPINLRHDTMTDCHLEKKRVIVRFHDGKLSEIVAAYEAAGFPVLEQIESQPAALAA